MFLVKDGMVYVVPALIAGALILAYSGNPYLSAFGGLVLALGLFFTWFFRDPRRKIVKNDSHIISPADGTVLEVSSGQGGQVIRIFLSVFNVHLQRAPVSGNIRNVEYKPGKFLPAMKPEAHVENEQNIITLVSAKGNFEVRQIAGILARRVVSWVKAGQQVEQGQQIGFIKFGSQVDLTVPASAKIKVKTGDKVRGGLTVLAEY
jgi:phosphatidylserine decarboxylase